MFLPGTESYQTGDLNTLCSVYGCLIDVNLNLIYIKTDLNVIFVNNPLNLVSNISRKWITDVSFRFGESGVRILGDIKHLSNRP